MTKRNLLKIFDYAVYTSDLKEIEIEPKSVISTINQFSFIIAERDPAFKEALINSDILLPDGVGIVGAARILKGQKIKKIAGADLHLYLLRKLNETGGRCFYLGSAEDTLEKIRKSIAFDFPNIRVGTYSPPFKTDFDEGDNKEMINSINAFKPDVLFVGMTAPKQEKWAYTNKDEIDAKLICSIGAVFDFYSGTIKRPGRIWINMGLEWLARLINEPAHVWKRYVLYGPVFVYKVLKEKLLMMFGERPQA